jgi:uncharacterized acetyltransferase MJ1064
MNIVLRCFGKILSKVDGLRRKYSIYANLRRLGLTESDNVSLGPDVNIAFPKNVTIGRGTYINGGDILASPNAKISIGENCLISYYVHMRTDAHNFRNAERYINKQGHSEADISIGNDVWIGYGAQIMSGVKIADGCVIGAGAIVTKNTEPYTIYAGVPAKKISARVKQ